MKKILLYSLVLFILAAVGCGKKSDTDSSKKDDKKDQTKVEDKSAGNDVKKDDKKSNELGLSEGMPSNFPKDIPTPKNSKCLGSINTSEGTVVTFESKDKVKDIIEFYKDEMKKAGFDIGEGGETLVSDQGGLIGWKKDTREIGLMIGFDKEKGVSSIALTYK